MMNISLEQSKNKRKEYLDRARALSKRQKIEVAKRFDGVRWDTVPALHQGKIGFWVADEKQPIKTGDIIILYNEIFTLQVLGRKVCGGYYPLPDARIEGISYEVWLDKIRRW